ncbi:hypothetical protein [Cellvibrio mixtus]|uniref:hypothetical protein n=1 Tax=Cellvibrio mixtus TaxID=39650 RepID=UPI000586C747|nr:hypothetical protein [Cellvibrio mixtus]
MPHPKKLFAYCWKSGAIEFGHKVPVGAIGLAEGEDKLVREKIRLTAVQEAQALIVPAMGAAFLNNDTDGAYSAAARYIATLDAISTVGFKAIGA